MKNYMKLGFGLVTGVLALVSTASAQNLLVNGSFESGLTGWTTNGNSGAVEVKSNAKGAESGSYAAQFNAGGTGSGGNITNGVLFQTITTTNGDAYSLSFYYGGYTQVSTNHGTEILGVEMIGSSVLSSNTITAAGYGSPAVFSEFTYTFVADSSATTIEFFDKTSNTKNDAGVLDNVTVVSAPEPSTLALSAVGGVFSLLALRRRK